MSSRPFPQKTGNNHRKLTTLSRRKRLSCLHIDEGFAARAIDRLPPNLSWDGNSSQFWQHLYIFDTSSVVRRYSSQWSIPGPILPNLFLNAHHHGSLPQQLKVVCSLLLQANSEGPSLIFRVVTSKNHLLSWHTNSRLSLRKGRIFWRGGRYLLRSQSQHIYNSGLWQFFDTIVFSMPTGAGGVCCWSSWRMVSIRPGSSVLIQNSLVDSQSIPCTLPDTPLEVNSKESLEQSSIWFPLHQLWSIGKYVDFWDST
jgi:hypothetical protein